MSPDPSGHRSSTATWATCGLLLLAAALRVPGLFTDFWFDEVSGYNYARRAQSLLDVATAIHHAANHWLIVGWMHVLGPGRDFWLYRLPSLLAGLAAVGLAGGLAQALSEPGDARRARALTMLLTATNFCLVEFSSEARGYALLVLAVLGASWCLLRFERGESARALPAYWAWMTVALFSQLVAVQFLASCILYTLCVHRRRALAPLVKLHGVPLAILGLMVVVDVSHFHTIGNTPIAPSDVAGDLAAFCLGGPNRGWAAAAAALLVVGLLTAFALRAPGRQAPGARPTRCWWTLPLLNLLVIPCFLMLGLGLPFFFARFCIAGVVLFLVALGVRLAAFGVRGGWRAALALALLATTLAANGWQWLRFQDQGRGHYREAIGEILSESPPGTITVAGVDDFTNRWLLDFYADYVSGQRDRLLYIESTSDGHERADWRVLCLPAETPLPDGSLQPEGGARYSLHSTYDTSWVSGVTWWVYRRDGS